MATAAPSAVQSAPKRLLILDSEAEERTLLRRRFTRFGYEVMEAADAEKALSLTSMIPFDLMLLELGAEGQGLEVLGAIRESRSRAELPIIVISDGAAEDAVQAMALGADDGLARPFDPETAYLRAQMQMRRGRGRETGRSRLEVGLARLEAAVVHAETCSALWAHVGVEVRAPLAGALNAATVLARLCETAELKPSVTRVDAATETLNVLFREAMGVPERRSRAPKTRVSVLTADDDAESRLAMRAMLHAAEAEVELVDVTTGLQAALEAESRFFDLIVVNVDAAEAIAGIRAIRRAERQNKARRTPMLAIARDEAAAANALAAGADLHMSPPITAERLLTAIATAITRESEALSAVA